jgi:multiple sugar transport system ATP-binding protein
MASLELVGIRKDFGDVKVLKGVDLAVENGEFVVFVGPSGCGKSTLLRLISGLDAASDGKIIIDGRDVAKLSPAERGIAMVFQSYALYPHMSVAQNLSFGLENLRLPRAEIDAKVLEAAKILAIEPYLDRRPKELSGGQRQRVAIGRAIVRDPDVFLFDEPLSNLDAALRVQTRAEISRLHKRLGATMIYVNARPGRGDDHGRPHRGAQWRAARTVRHARGTVPEAGEQVRRDVHRLAADEYLSWKDRREIRDGRRDRRAGVQYDDAQGRRRVTGGRRPRSRSASVRSISSWVTHRSERPLHIDYAESIGTETYAYGQIAGAVAETILHLPEHRHFEPGEAVPIGRRVGGCARVRRRDRQGSPGDRHTLGSQMVDHIVSASPADATAAIQSAIESAAATPGGGRVVLQRGRHSVQGLRLRSSVELHLETGAELTFAASYDAYAGNVVSVIAEGSDRACIVGQGLTNCAITGAGVIRGPGPHYIDGEDAEVGTHIPSALRPRLIVLEECARVKLEGMRIEDSPMWTVHLVSCRHVRIDGIAIRNDRLQPNTDGIVVDSCSDVVIENVSIDTADDGVCLKTTLRDGAFSPCTGVVVRNTRVSSQSCA